MGSELRKDSTKNFIIDFSIIIIVSSFLYLGSIKKPELTVTGESREGAIAWQILKTNNWVFPIVNGERLPEKPILFPYLCAISMKLFGKNEFALRLPSSLLAILCLLLTYLLAYKAFKTRTIALLSSLILAVSVNYYALATKARIDMTLCFFTTMALFFLYSVFYENKPKYYLFTIPFVTLAILSKGPLGLAFFIWVAFFFLVLTHKTQDNQLNYISIIIRKILYPFKVFPFFRIIIVSLILSALWYVPAYLQALKMGYKNEFIDIVLIKENIGMPLGLASGGGHEHNFFYFIPYFFINFAPFSLFLPLVIYKWLNPALPTEIRTSKTPLPINFFLVWAGLGFLFFSIPMGKRPDYLVLLYPAFSISTAYFTLAKARNEWRARKLYNLVCFLIFFVLILGLLLPLLNILLPKTIPSILEKFGKNSEDIQALIEPSKSFPREYTHFTLITFALLFISILLILLVYKIKHSHNILKINDLYQMQISPSLIIILLITGFLEVYISNTYLSSRRGGESMKSFFLEVNKITHNENLFNYKSFSYTMSFWLNKDAPNIAKVIGDKKDIREAMYVLVNDDLLDEFREFCKRFNKSPELILRSSVKLHKRHILLFYVKPV